VIKELVDCGVGDLN